MAELTQSQAQAQLVQSSHAGTRNSSSQVTVALQGQLPAAVSHLERVLEISKEIDDHVGDADAHGTIADIYTDMGKFPEAAKSYDMYIKLMSEGS